MSAEDIPFLIISRALSLSLPPPPPPLSQTHFGSVQIVKPPASRSEVLSLLFLGAVQSYSPLPRDLCVSACVLSALPRNQRLFFASPPPSNMGIV
jgi:hypothetical protein